jgi:hypothetical protein
MKPSKPEANSSATSISAALPMLPAWGRFRGFPSLAAAPTRVAGVNQVTWVTKPYARSFIH